MASKRSDIGAVYYTSVKPKESWSVSATPRVLTRSWKTKAQEYAASDGIAARVYVLAAVAVVLSGIALRVYAFLLNRPLWLDEAMLALNITTRSYGELLQPLAFDQWAPPLFLWLERFVVETAGVSEATLRFIPLLAGLAMVVLAWPVARYFLGNRDAIFATAILALQLTLSRYATEVKPYGTDAFVTMMVLGLLVFVLGSPVSRWRWLCLIIGGGLALTFSHPALFVLAGVPAALIMDRRTRQSPAFRMRLVSLCLAWALVFVVMYATLYTAGTNDAYLARYWEGSYLLRMLGAERTWLRGAVFCTGLVVFWRRNQSAAVAALAVPILALGMAAAVHAYPLTTRLMVFLAPISAVAYASALGFALSLVPRSRQLATFGFLLAAMAARQIYYVDRYLGSTINSEDSRELVEWISRERHGAPVYVNAFGAPAWAFYTTDWTSPDPVRLDWFESVLSSRGVAFANRPSRHRTVINEGAEIQFEWQSGIDLVGIGTGMEYRNAKGHLQPRPDPGWASNEIARIRRVAAPFAWVLLSHYTESQQYELLAALEIVGGRVLESASRSGAAAYRVCFPTHQRDAQSTLANACST